MTNLRLSGRFGYLLGCTSAILGFVLSIITDAQGQSLGVVWGAHNDDIAVVNAQVTDAGGAAKNADAPPTVDVFKVPKTGSDIQITINAAMDQYGSELGSYFYRFTEDQTDSAGIVYTVRVEAVIDGVTTAKMESFRRGQSLGDLITLLAGQATAQIDLDNPAQYMADVSALATAAALSPVASTVATNLDTTVTSRQPSGAVALTSAERASTADSVWLANPAFTSGSMGDSLLAGAAAAGVAGAAGTVAELQVGVYAVHPQGQTLFLSVSHNVAGIATDPTQMQYSVLRDGTVVSGWTAISKVAGITGYYGVSYTIPTGADGTFTVLMRATTGGDITQGLGSFVVENGYFRR